MQHRSTSCLDGDPSNPSSSPPIMHATRSSDPRQTVETLPLRGSPLLTMQFLSGERRYRIQTEESAGYWAWPQCVKYKGTVGTLQTPRNPVKKRRCSRCSNCVGGRRQTRDDCSSPISIYHHRRPFKLEAMGSAGEVPAPTAATRPSRMPSGYACRLQSRAAFVEHS